MPEFLGCIDRKEKKVFPPYRALIHSLSTQPARALLLVAMIVAGISLSGCHNSTRHNSSHHNASQPSYISYRNVAISSDGSHVAYIESAAGMQSLVMRSTHNQEISKIDLCHDCSAVDIHWSHAGDSLALLVSHQDNSQIYLPHWLAHDLGEPFYTFTGIISQLQYSPDDLSLGLLAIENPHKHLGATAQGVPNIGLINTEIDEQRIAKISLVDPSPRLQFLSPADRFAYTLSWLPNGNGLIASMAKGDGDAHWWRATLNYVDAITGLTHVIARPQYQMQYPVVSPDSQSVAFIGGIMSDAISPGGDIYVVPVTGGTPHNLTPHAQQTYTFLQWTRQGLYAQSTDGLTEKLTMIPGSSPGDTINNSQNNSHGSAPSPITSLADGATTANPKTVWDAGRTQGRMIVNDTGTMVISARESFTAPENIFVGKVDSPKQITNDNHVWKAQITAHPVTWENNGYHLDGWLLTPDHASSGKHPMLVDVHGGPAAVQDMVYVNLSTDLKGQELWTGLLKEQYFIFLPNPRGSYGQGEAFTQANKADFGGGDFKDITSGITQLSEKYPIDSRRLAITGVSYGGFMTMWAAAHSHVFKAAIAGAGISDWVSYYNDNGISDWIDIYFGKSLYADPGVYLHQSPIMNMNKPHTPTFIWVGENDIECPPAQSLEFFHALQHFHVPTQLYIYPQEGHGLRQEAHRKDVTQRSIDWLHTYLK